MSKHKSNKIKENSNTVRHLIMGQITTTQNLVAIKEVRHAGQLVWIHTIQIVTRPQNTEKSAFLAIMPLFEIIWRIDDLRHCGTYGFVKHKVFTHWGLVQAVGRFFQPKVKHARGSMSQWWNIWVPLVAATAERNLLLWQSVSTTHQKQIS